MYDELVKALRGCVLSKPCEGCPYYDPNGPSEKCATMNIAAADAIEELSKQHEAQRENIVALMDIIENDRKEIEWLKKCVNDLPKPVRCRDCIHLSGVTNGGTFFRCDRYDRWQDESNRVYMPLDGFCSYGQEKEET